MKLLNFVSVTIINLLIKFAVAGHFYWKVIQKSFWFYLRDKLMLVWRSAQCHYSGIICIWLTQFGLCHNTNSHSRLLNTFHFLPKLSISRSIVWVSINTSKVRSSVCFKTDILPSLLEKGYVLMNTESSKSFERKHFRVFLITKN